MDIHLPIQYYGALKYLDKRGYKMIAKDLEWNVVDENGMAYNIFQNGKFIKCFEETYAKCGNINKEFEIEILKDIKWCFGHKCEYEIVVCDWVHQSKHTKIDYSYQIQINFEAFINYLKYLETHKAESLEELGWCQDEKYDCIYNKIMNDKLVTQIELDCYNKTMDFIFENINYDAGIYFLTKQEIQAMLNKMEELENE